MELYLLRDYIGLFAPIILFFLSLFLLRNNKKYLYFFFYGFILNNILNIILKVAIKEPRPTTERKVIEIGIANEARISFDKFGMPSGHAQNCAYCLVFITMVLNDPFITAFYIVITFNTLFQRYLYNNHTILQLVIGSFIGLFFGYTIYTIANKNIMGNIKMKKDDNALFV
jgi:membrane-associated phospholipid phosphatase